MRVWNSPFLLLVVATCLWGGNFVVGSQYVSSISPVTLALLRWIVAFIIVIPFLGKSIWQEREIYLKHWKSVLLLSLTGVAGFNTFLYIALQYTSPINASLMNAATPIIMISLSYFILRSKISWWGSIGILLSMIGVLWIISRGSWQILISLSFNRGDLWMLLAIILWAIYSIWMKKTAGQFSINGLFAVTCAVTILLLLPFSFLEFWRRDTFISFDWSMIVAILYLGILASVVAFTCWNRAVSLIGPERSANYLNLIPLFSALFATLFTNEVLQLYHIFGSVCIIGGVYLTTKLSGMTGRKTKGVKA